MKIDEKVAVVTGAASGIGNAVAHRLARGSAALVGMVDLTDEVSDAAQQLNSKIGRTAAIAFQGDVTDREFRAHVFHQLGKQDVVRICVPAAGILRDAMAVKVNPDTHAAELYDEDLFRKVLDVNLVHPVYWTMQMLAGIASQRAREGSGRWTSEEPMQGASVIIGSVSCRGNRGQVSYSSAKSGLNAAAKTLNVEGAYHGVQVKALHPGFVATPMVEQLPDGMFEEHLRKMIPIDRKILPEEIAEAIVAIIENPIISGPVWADGGFPPMA
jgi:NAD(P)-dependent dehydrogenase (short-subunit alcohol dehydrogenase family)